MGVQRYFRVSTLFWSSCRKSEISFLKQTSFFRVQRLFSACLSFLSFLFKLVKSEKLEFMETKMMTSQPILYLCSHFDAGDAHNEPEKTVQQFIVLKSKKTQFCFNLIFELSNYRTYIFNSRKSTSKTPTGTFSYRVPSSKREGKNPYPEQ